MNIVVFSLNVRAKLKNPIAVLFVEKVINKFITVVSLNVRAKLKKPIAVLFAVFSVEKPIMKLIKNTAKPGVEN